MIQTKQIRGWLLSLFVALVATCGLLVTAAPAHADDATSHTLVITKEVANPDAAPSNQKFKFKVLFLGPDYAPQTYDYRIGDGDIQTMDSGGTLSLAAGESATFELPEDAANYEVEELPLDGWNLLDQQNVVEGDFTSDEPVTITFTNAYVVITTSASVNGSQTITAGADPITVTDEVRVAGLKENTTYKVEGSLVKKSDANAVVATATTELGSKGSEEQTVTLEYKDVNVSDLGGEQLVSLVTISADDVVFEHKDVNDADQTITVEKEPEPEPEPGKGSLKIAKTVSTPATDQAIEDVANNKDLTSAQKQAQTTRLQNRKNKLTSKEFTFTVTLTDADGKALEGEFAYTGDAEGKIKSGGTVTLTSGQSVTIADLPEGTKYKVAEEDADNWKCEPSGDEGTITKDEVAEASFTNTPLGQLKVSKTLAGDVTDDLKDTEFTFTVLIYEAKEKDTDPDAQMKGDFSYTGDKEGTIKSGGTVTLKGGQHVLFGNLPVGIVVRVRETPVDGWTAQSTSLKGTTVEGVPLAASFVNTYSGTNPEPEPEPEPGKGSLKISKTVATPATDQAMTEASNNATLSEAARRAELARLQQRKDLLKAVEFAFTVTLADADGNALEGTFAYAGSKEGTLKSGDTILLADSQSVTISDLPEGATYVVTEAEQDNWKSEATGSEGTIVKDEVASASFTNTPLGQLRVSKTVVGATTDELKNTEFTFTVLFYQADSEVELQDEFAYTGDKAGSLRSGGTVTLKGGQSISFANLPVGITVRVRETATTGWNASSTSLRGTTVEGVPLSAAFVNTYVGNRNVNPYNSDNPSNSSSNSRNGSTSKPTAPSTVPRKSTPDTGDTTIDVTVIALGGMALAVAGVGFVVRRQR